MHSPIPLACGFGLGLALGWACPGLSQHSWLALVALALGTVVAASSGRSVARLWAAATPTLLTAAAVAAGATTTARVPEQSELPPAGSARFAAWVESVHYAAPERAVARLRVTSGARLSDGASIPAATYLLASPFPLPEGARVQVVAMLRPSLAFRNPSPHPQLPAAARVHGRAILSSADAFTVLEQPWHWRAIEAFRCGLRRQLWNSLPSDSAAVASAILLGDPDALDPEDDAAVRGSGLSHVFAVSGMHVTLLAGLLVWALTRALLRVHALAARFEARRWAAALGIPLALSIAVLTGGAASGWRASITTAIAWLAIACGRRPSGGAVTAAACLVFAAASPLEALRPGFLLSIVATVSILTSTRLDTDSLRGLIVAAGWLAVRTSLATAPIVWWAFGSLPLFGVLANLALVPLGELLLLLAAAHAAWACCLPRILQPLAAPLTAAPFTLAARAFLRGCSIFSSWEPQLTLPVLSLPQGIALSVTVAIVLLSRRARTRCWAGCGGLALLLVLECQLRYVEKRTDVLRVTFVDVGQGDAALIDLPDGRCMLIDAGGNPQGGADPGAVALVPLLHARRRDRIDVVVLTHPHPDHYGGLRAVFDAVPVAELWDNGQSAVEAASSATSQQAAAIVAIARQHGTRMVLPAELCTRPRNYGAARVEVLWPCPSFDAGFDPNDNSLVLHIHFGAHSVLFTGDIEAHAEAALRTQPIGLHADVLKVAHHGSRTSSDDAFLARVAPTLAIISAGAVNPFGHPHAETLERLQRHAERVIDIGKHGGAMVTFAADGIRVE